MVSPPVRAATQRCSAGAATSGSSAAWSLGVSLAGLPAVDGTASAAPPEPSAMTPAGLDALAAGAAALLSDSPAPELRASAGAWARRLLAVQAVPDRVTVRKVDLGQELQILAYHELRKSAEPVLAGPLADAALVSTAGGEQ